MLSPLSYTCLKNKFKNFFLLCLFGEMPGTHVESEDIMQESILFPHVGPEGGTQVVSLGSKHL